jgi:hypothetical protein
VKHQNHARKRNSPPPSLHQHPASRVSAIRSKMMRTKMRRKVGSARLRAYRVGTTREQCLRTHPRVTDSDASTGSGKEVSACVATHLCTLHQYRNATKATSHPRTRNPQFLSGDKSTISGRIPPLDPR